VKNLNHPDAGIIRSGFRRLHRFWQKGDDCKGHFDVSIQTDVL